jgi:long-subunit acyl-CoA synthetase (AMP-forming)
LASSASTIRSYSWAKPSEHDSDVKLPLFSTAFEPKYKDKIGFTDHRGTNFSYSELGNKSLQLAKQLKELTGNEEARIAFLCPHDASFPITLWACWMANHVGECSVETRNEHSLHTYLTKIIDKSIKLFLQLIFQPYPYRRSTRKIFWSISLNILKPK